MKNFILIILFISTVHAQIPVLFKTEKTVINYEKLDYIDSVVTNFIKSGDNPGAVILIGSKEKILYKKAFGNSWLEPVKKPMTLETCFDLASITKPVATATSIMILVERGVISLEDEVRTFIPEFSPFIDSDGKVHHARIYHLLTHTSGLPAYTNVDSIRNIYGFPAPKGTTEFIFNLPKLSAPGKEFRYSCLGYITLAEIVKRTTGKNIHEFSKENIFKPLGMKNTTYNPNDKLAETCAPTEFRDGRYLCGVVHDPLAYLQGGISGNAGLFSTAEDLAIFAQMLLNDGTFKGKRILSKKTIDMMTNVYHKVAFAQRGLGWDINSSYMQQRGDLFEVGAYGHTGFTGTSILISPKENLFLIILTNRVHPVDKGNTQAIHRMRKLIANVVASSLE